MNKRYSKLSAILSVICALTIFASYTIAPEQPEGMMVVLLKSLFFISIVSGITSLIFSYYGFKNKEEGFLKKVAPIIVILILLTFVFSFIAIVLSFM